MTQRRSGGGRAAFGLASGLASLVACAGPPPPGAASPTMLAPAAAAAPSPAAEERERYIERALSNPHPAALGDRHEVAEGTGFYVARDKILTNDHVVRDCAALTAGNGTEGEEVVARVAARDPGDDLALLEVDVAAEPASFETELYAETGRDLAIVGYPAHGLAVRLAELSPAATNQAELLASKPTFPFNGEVHPGNSGSPVLDNSGAVIGVVVKKVDTVAVYHATGKLVDDVGIAIANRVVIDFLRANRVAILSASPSMPLAPERLLDEAHRFVRQIGCWR
jgi:serine protease Do